MEEYMRRYGLPEGADIVHLVGALENQGYNIGGVNSDGTRSIDTKDNDYSGYIKGNAVNIEGRGNGYNGLDKFLDKYEPRIK